jgi:tetratricopeptide (TPR) repeat protein
MKRIAAIVALVLGVAAASTGAVSLHQVDAAADGNSLLYLPNGRYLKIASLGHSALMADLVYLWSIQHYSNYEREDRFRYVEHVFGKVIAELDPGFTDAYSLGAMILSVEAHDLPGALRLLDLGMERNPDDWILPYIAGWESFHAGEFGKASDYFAKASQIPGAPDLIARNRAGAVARSGDVGEAYRLWRELYEDPEIDDTTRAIAERQVRELHVRIDLKAIRAAVSAYRSHYGRWPAGIGTLVSEGLLPNRPRDPDGQPYAYNPATGETDSSANRILGDR